MFTKRKFSKRPLSLAVSAAIVPALSATALAQTTLEEVVVTATKRAASTQDIAVSVEALTSDTIDDFGISNFEDYLIQLPGVTAGGSGPGQNKGRSYTHLSQSISSGNLQQWVVYSC